MSDDTLREALSALVDGELPEAEAAPLLDRVAVDPALREQWRRHHLLSGLLSGQGDAPLGASELSRRIERALEHEPPQPAPVTPLHRPAPPGRRFRLGAIAALAASVAALAVVTVSLTQRGDVAAPGPRQVAATTAGQVAPEVERTAPGVQQSALAQRTRLTWNEARPGVEARLNMYLLSHNEYLSEGVRGMLPYARVVGYDARD